MGAESKILRLGALTGLVIMILGSLPAVGSRPARTLGAFILMLTPTTALLYVVYDSYKQKNAMRVVAGILTVLIVFLSAVLAFESI